MRIFSKSFIICMLVLVAVAISPSASALSNKGYVALHKFSKVLHYIEDNYFRQINDKKVLEGAIYGMLGELDPHSVYLPPNLYRDLQASTRGRFEGIGVEVTVRDGKMVVVSPIRGTPADRAGIQSGDCIIKIDGKPTSAVNLGEAIGLMRGHRGSRVVLTIVRDGKKHPFDVTVMREMIRLPSVKWKLYNGDIAYASIINFQDDASSSLRKAISKMNWIVNKRLGKGRTIRGLILDLRKDPGGLLEQAVAVSDIFLKNGKIVSTETRGKIIDVRKAHGDGTEPNYPIIVLIDRGSASASEIVAGALQDHKRATIMGEKSFGKGTVQTIMDLDDGSAIKITIARYLTPSGRCIQGIGIKPDVGLAISQNAGNKRKHSAAGKRKDYWLSEAIAYMKNTLLKDSSKGIRN